MPSRYSTLNVIQSFYVVVQVSFKLFCCMLSYFKPMHKGLKYFGFHHIIMFKIQAQMKHKNLCFGFNYPIHWHFNFHCHVQVLCALLCSSFNLHHQKLCWTTFTTSVVDGYSPVLFQFPSSTGVLLFWLLIRCKRASLLLLKKNSLLQNFFFTFLNLKFKVSFALQFLGFIFHC